MANLTKQWIEQDICTIRPAAIRHPWTIRPQLKCREIGRYSARAECKAGIWCNHSHD